jgi:hypothetical protein
VQPNGMWCELRVQYLSAWWERPMGAALDMVHVVIGMLGSVTVEVKWVRCWSRVRQVKGQKGIDWQWGQGHQKDQL